ncbi:WAG22 antigen-like isoform X2 [Tenebrio molitor]|uniref:WAG22 antigen-like isoform X2 n=1 Tax=Tenebrio molitor TaxID=7067 RepID=UPI003624ABDB
MFVRVDIFLIVVLLKVVQIATNNIIDVDDILAEDYMPGTLLMLENPKGAIRNFNDSVGGDLTSREGDGTFDEAMETMGFHRSKMNEYLCRNYVAEEIIGDMTLSRIKRRMGSNTHGIQTHAKDKVSVKNQLLQDEGSSNYKDWLSKSTTLEDIYRHYDNVNNRVDDHGEDADKDDELNEDYDGQIMGYSFHQQQQGGPPAKLGHSGFSGGGGGYPYPQSGPHGGGGGGGYPYGGGSGGGYGGMSAHGGGGGHPGFSGHGVQEPEPIIHEQPKYHVVHEESHSEKEHDLSDLFDIALTALAYLSFGMFIIHVIMCISMAHNNASTATGMMMPMSMSPTSTGMTGGGTGGGTGGTGTGGGTGGGDTGTGGGTGDGGGTTGTGDGATGTGDGGGTGGDGGDGATGTGDGGGTGGDGATGTGDGGGDIDTGDGGGDIDTGDGGGTGGDGATSTGDGGGTGSDGTTSTGDGGGTGGDGEPTGGGSTGTGTGGTGTGTGTGGTGTGTGGTGTGTGGTGTGTGGTATGRDPVNLRLKRDMPTITNPNNEALNELARRILTSIEAAFVANDDDGNCLRQTLCENNKFSRSVEGNNKILIPVWRYVDFSLVNLSSRWDRVG